MRQSEFRRPLRFMLGELRKIIKETGGRTAVEASPKGGFANGSAAGSDHVAVVIGHPANHMGMRLDVAHFGLVLAGPGATGSFGGRSGNRFFGRITESQ